MSDASEKPTLLQREELERLVDLINYRMRQHPRVIGSLVTHAVPTCIEELNAGYASQSGSIFDAADVTEMVYLRSTANQAGCGVFGLPELLSSLCSVYGANVYLDYEQSGVKLRVRGVKDS